MRTIGSALMVAAWAGTACGQLCEPSWSDEFAVGPDDTVYAAFAGAGPLYVGGRFVNAGGVQAARIAAYEDGAWSPLGLGFRFSEACWSGHPQVRAILDPGLPGLDGLVAGGGMSPLRDSTLVGRWDGAAWHAMGDGLRLGLADVCSELRDLAVFDDGAGPAFYASGLFAIPAVGVARWSGTAWESIDGGLGGFGLSGGGHALAVHDDGSGPSLYVAGRFTMAGSATVRNIARWTPGAGWSALGNGLGFEVQSLVEFDGGAGPVLLAAGGESGSGEVWRWDGAAWSQMGGAFDGRVNALAVFDDGAPTGPAVYAGGEFHASAGRPIRGLARWDGAQWVEAAGGVAGPVHVLAPSLHAGVRTLIVGGSFFAAGPGVQSQNIARLIGCAQVCYADCDRDGSLTFFDFLCFQNLFAAADPQADCDGSGGHDFFDFLCFQNAFAAGCP